MFRIIVECSRFNGDKAIADLLQMAREMQKNGMLDKLPGGIRIPGFLNAEMISRLPEKQKLQLFSKAIQQEQTKMISSLQMVLTPKIGDVRIRSIALDPVGEPSCMVRLRIDVERMDYDRVIDLLVEKVIDETAIPDILGEAYEPGITKATMGYYVHGQQENAKEYLVLRSMSTHKAGLIPMLEAAASGKGVELTISALKFLLKQ